MRAVKIKHVGEVNIFPDKEIWPLECGIAFSEEEYVFALKLAASIHADPEQQKSFWEVLISKKKDNPHYSLFTDFPKEPPQELSDKAKLARKYCGETLLMLRGGKNEGEKEIR